MLQEINTEILVYLNSFSDKLIIEKIVCIFTDGPIFFLPLFLICAWLYYTFKEKNQEKKQNLLFIFYSVVIGILISYLIKQFIYVDRPETVIKGTGKLLLKHIPDASFPSDHATVSFAFLTGLFLAHYKKIGFIFLPFVIIMNISRIVAGVHWPLDIIAGAIIGINSGAISFYFLKKKNIIKKINLFIIKIMSYIKL